MAAFRAWSLSFFQRYLLSVRVRLLVLLSLVIISWFVVLVAFNPHTHHQREALADSASTHHRNHKLQTKAEVLVAVMTSRKKFARRVAALEATWAASNNLPSRVLVKYFVGKKLSSDDADDDIDATTEESEDKKQLASSAGLLNEKGFDPDEAIVILPNVFDDERPPVRKQAAILKAVVAIASTSQRQIRWIMKCDDDALLNLAMLQKLVSSFDSKGLIVLGEHGYGAVADRPSLREFGLKLPFCSGSPGFIMSRVLSEKLALTLDACVERANNVTPSSLRKRIWQPDIVSGLCMQTDAVGRVGCEPSRKKLFVSHKEIKSVLNAMTDSEVQNLVSIHPLRQSDVMAQQFLRMSALPRSKVKEGRFSFTDLAGDTVFLAHQRGKIKVSVSSIGDVGVWKGFDARTGNYEVEGGTGTVPKARIPELLAFLGTRAASQDN